MQFSLNDLVRMGMETAEKERKRRMENKEIVFVNVQENEKDYCFMISIDNYAFLVYSSEQNGALSVLADYLIENEFDSIVADHYTISDDIETGQTVEEYAAENNLIQTENGLYINGKNLSIRKLTTEKYLFKVLKEGCFIGAYIDVYNGADHEQIKEYAELYYRLKTEFKDVTINSNNFDYDKLEQNKRVIN